MCGAVLLVPLSLSAPGAGFRAAEEVVLAAGPPGGAAAAGEEEAFVPAADADVNVEDRVDEAPTDEPAEASLSVIARPKSKPAAASKITASTKPKPKPKPTAKAKAAVVAAGPATPAAAATAASRATTAAKAAAAAAPAPPPPAPTPTPTPAPAPAPAPSAGDAVWDRLAQCESSNTNDGGAPYYGYWQFSASTWHSVGEPGLPNDHPRERQLAAAKRLQAAQGWAPWPDCSRRLGLR